MVGSIYNAEELFGKFIKAIERDQPHQHYNRTTDLAKFYRQIMTGENQDDLIVSYKTRETEEQKQQRIAVTLSRTKYVANKIYNQFDEIRRVDNVIDNIAYVDSKNDERIKTLNDALGEFYADKHLRFYLYDRLRFLTFYDPNAFLVVERRESVKDDGTITTRSYPIEIYSEQVYDFERYLGVLQYIVSKVVRSPKLMAGYRKKEEVYRYVLYAEDVAFEALELHDGEDVSMYQGYDRVSLFVGDKLTEKTFLIKQMETLSGMCPAICVGYLPDAMTFGETFVSPMDPAEHLFRKLVNRNSELELHRALHGFYQKFVIAEECDYRDINSGQACIDGSLSDGTKCPSCKGTGHVTHRSVQDVMYIIKPKSKEEHIPLSEYVHYVEIPQYITESIEKDIDKLEREIGEAIFSNEVFDKTEVAATATEARLNIRGLYNALSSYADQYSELYKHAVWQTAFYLDIAEGLIVEHAFPADFKMETVQELISQRATAINAGAPYAIIQKIDMAILQKQNQDDPDYIQAVQAREEHRPFRGKTESERAMLFNALPSGDPVRVLWIYFDEIMSELIRSNEGQTPFVKLPYDRRKELVDMKVIEYGQKLEEMEGAARAGQMNNFMNQFNTEEV